MGKVAETSLIEVDIDGENHHLEMMNGSLWYVNPGDLPTIATWLPTSEIHICRKDKSMFGYEITNVGEDATINAMKVS